MLSRSQPNPSDVLEVFSSRNIPVAFFCATDVALGKSIIDATGPVRDLLREQGVHNFEEQAQGKENKVLKSTYILSRTELIETKTSLYRPETKQGDPRFWVYKFAEYAKPWDLHALIVVEGYLYIINCNDSSLLESINDDASPFGRLSSHFTNALSSEASELLEKLKEISAREYIESLRAGSTGVGYTLETLLGIEANSSAKPDFKGIEIKSSRANPSSKRAANRTTLFSQVPNWNMSALKARDLLDSYGYLDKEKNRIQLYCSLTALKPNTLNLGLLTQESLDLLFLTGNEGVDLKKLCVWEGRKLRDRLSEKHGETFWVKAASKSAGGKEYFHYYEVIHTKKPILGHLFYLLSDGTIEVDLTLSEKPKGVRDHGYLFKIWPNDINKLMPHPARYLLSDRSA